MNQDLQTYWDNTQKPWGKLFYRVVWDQLPDIHDREILDFGSGFGITAFHYCTDNHIVAVEPNSDLVEARVGKGAYCQLTGGIECLNTFNRESFDYIFCHNVLEYAAERAEIVREFSRLLRPGGTISIVKHNHPGRIMQKVVFENALDEAISMLQGGTLSVRNFGKVVYYSQQDLLKWVPDLKLEKVMGIRTFWALQQDNTVKENPEWQDKIFLLEKLVAENETYRGISFFHHLLLTK